MASAGERAAVDPQYQASDVGAAPLRRVYFLTYW
jgi:hypothetical protein